MVFIALGLSIASSKKVIFYLTFVCQLHTGQRRTDYILELILIWSGFRSCERFFNIERSLGHFLQFGFYLWKNWFSLHENLILFTVAFSVFAVLFLH